MTLGIIGLALGAATSAYTSINGAIRSRKAREAINQIEQNRVQYENNFANLQVSTLGAEYQRDQLRQANASALNQVRSGGSRAMVGMVPQLLSNNANVSNQIAANLDEQQSRLNLMRAEYDNRIQEVEDQRQREALQGYGMEMQSANQDFVTGLNNITGIGMMAGRLFGNTSEGTDDKTTV